MISAITKRDVFDVADWHPVKPDAFLETLGECALTSDEPSTLTVKVEDLDGRVRLVVYGKVMGESESSPVLMLLYTSEGGVKSGLVCMERHVDLDH